MQRKVFWCIAILLGVAAMAFGETLPASATSQFVVRIYPQGRINVDTEGNILSIYNITDGSNVQPPYLNIYQGGVKISMTPGIQANLDSISPQIDWSQDGLVYQQGGVVQTATASVKPVKTEHGLSQESGSSGFWISTQPLVVDLPRGTIEQPITPVDCSSCIVTRRYYLEWGESLGFPCLVVVEKFESF